MSDIARTVLEAALRHYREGAFLNLINSIDMSCCREKDGPRTVHFAVKLKIMEACGEIKLNPNRFNALLEKCRHMDRVADKCARWRSDFNKRGAIC